MDKGQRAEIVAVKLSEVIAEENKLVREADEKILEQHTDTPDIQKLKTMKKQYNSMKKSLNTYQKEIEKKIEELNAKDSPIKINSNFYGRNDECSLTITLREDSKTFGNSSMISPRDIVTHVMRHRNCNNARIAKVSEEGYELVVEDKDDKQLKAFLEL